MMADLSITVRVIFCLIMITNFSRADNFRCPAGWTKYNNECLTVILDQLPWQQASDYCKGQTPDTNSGSLIEIHSKETNDFVKGLVKHSNMEFWINIRSKYTNYGSLGIYWNRTGTSITNGYMNFKVRNSMYARSAGFGFMDDLGNWYVSPKTNISKRFVCRKVLDCEDGYFGISCESPCHCYKTTPCHRVYGRCPYGCSLGWMGLRCDKEKHTAKVAVYCFKLASGERSALIRVDSGGVEYDNIYTPGVSGADEAYCNKSLFRADGNGVLNLKIRVNDDGSTSPDCSSKVISNEVFEWNLRTEEIEGVYSYFDRKFKLQCDFSKAESLARDFQQTILGMSVIEKIRVKQSTENVRLFVQDPVTMKELTQTKVGSRIQLVMMFNKKDDVVLAKGISPYNCTGSTGDGKITKSLIDVDGCPTKNTPVYAQTGSDFSVLSNVFDAFTIGGRSEIIFTCNFEFCFEANMTKCTDRCSYSHAQERVKRSSDEISRVEEASAVLHLIADDENDKVEEMGSKPLTYFNLLMFSVFGVVLIGTVVIVLYRRTRLQSSTHCAVPSP